MRLIMKTPSVEEVKKLRRLTGYGMMDCKKALTICNLDVENAIKYLHKAPLHPHYTDKWIEEDEEN